MKKVINAKILENNQLVNKEILFDEDKIIKIADTISEDVETIDAKGNVVLPGLIDVHVHLREPGYEYKETIKSGTLAAAKGGFTTIFAMPNVKPFPDDVETIKDYLEKIKQDAIVHVHPYACITTAEVGSEVVDMKAIQDLGILGFSDDGVGVQSDEVMRKAMQKAHEIGSIIVAHTEDMTYRSQGASMHEGIRNKELGYIGIPSACEYAQIERDLKLVEETGSRYHICHMSARKSVEYLRDAKAKGLSASGEVTAHHLLLNEMAVNGPTEKMNPPLRSSDDQEALLQGLKDGVIDCIANDHAPHSDEEKSREMDKAPFGIIGLETAFPLLYTNLVETGKATFEELVSWMSEKPAELFGLKGYGKLKEGYASDFIIVDIETTKEITKEDIVSKGKNTPFLGWKCKGFIDKTIVSGTCVYEEEATCKEN